MKKIFQMPVIAVILCLALILASSVISTRIRLDNMLVKAASEPAQLNACRAVIDGWRSHFPGNVIIPLSGFDFG